MAGTVRPMATFNSALFCRGFNCLRACAMILRIDKADSVLRRHRARREPGRAVP